MSLHGLAGSMTPWKYANHLLLVVFLSTIDRSKEYCHDYISNEELAKNLDKTIPFVMTKDPKDAVECTAKKLTARKEMKLIFNQCFNATETESSEKCEGEIYEIPYHHYLCLVFKISEKIPKDVALKACEYETTCKIYSGIASAVFQQTNSPSPTTTLPERTTAATTTALSTPPKTTATSTTTTATTTMTTTTTTTTTPKTTIATSTTATTTATTTTTTAPKTTTTTKVTQRANEGRNGITSYIKNETENKKTENIEFEALKVLLVISVAFNFVLVAYVCWRHRTGQDCRPPCNSELYEASSEAQPMTEMESSTPRASVIGNDAEISHLIQPNECVSVFMHSADERSDCAVGNEMQQ